MKVFPKLFTCESHRPSAVQTFPGQDPEVVEWLLPTQVHTTVVLAGIVVVLLWLTVSTKLEPLWPTFTVAVKLSGPFRKPLVSTTSKSEPWSWPRVCKSVSSKFGSDAPLMNQLEPLSARIRPYFCMA